MDDDREIPQPMLVRTRLPDPESVGEDEVLVERIRAEIRSAGPMTFARFMERALYEPGHGYYRRGEPGPGRDGDFLTAPEAHPIFGAAIGRLLEESWDALGRPAPFVVREHGAGTGALAAGLLVALRDAGSPLFDVIRYRPIEVEAARDQAFRARLLDLDLAPLIDDGPAVPDRPETGAVVANEVLDALPVHRVVGRPGGPTELFVGLDEDGALIATEGSPSTGALADRLADEGIELADGQVAEVCLRVEDWLADATAAPRTRRGRARRLRRGARKPVRAGET